MATPNSVSGRARIKIDGISVPVAGDTTLTPGGPLRELVDGDYETGNYRETTKGSMLEFSALDKLSFSTSWFGALTNATVSIEFDNGRNYVMRNAWSEGPPPLTTTDGKIKCKMMGPPATELR